MNRFFESFWGLSQELAFPLFAGAAIAGLVHLFLDKEQMTKYLSGHKYAVVFKAVLFGLPLPLCSCGVLPLAISLRSKGLNKGAVNGFLVSTPQTGVDSFLVAASFFSWPFALIKLLLALVLGLITGLTSSFFDGDEEFVSEYEEKERKKPNKLQAWWDHSLDVLQSIWFWLFIGLVISSLISLLTEQFKVNELMSSLALWQQMGLMLLVSLPLYVCATASIPIAMGFVIMGMHPAAALVFLIAGPASNAAVILPLSKILGWRHVMIQLIIVIIGSCLGAYYFSSYLSVMDPMGPSHHHESSSWYQLTAAVLLLSFFLKQIFEVCKDKFNQGPKQGDVESYSMDGINCQACVNKIKKASHNYAELQLVEVDKEKKFISFQADEKSRVLFLSQLEDLGFTNIQKREP